MTFITLRLRLKHTKTDCKSISLTLTINCNCVDKEIFTNCSRISMIYNVVI